MVNADVGNTVSEVDIGDQILIENDLDYYNVVPQYVDLDIFDEELYTLVSEERVLWDVNGPIYEPNCHSDVNHVQSFVNPILIDNRPVNPEKLTSRVVNGVKWYRPCSIDCDNTHTLCGMNLQLNPCAFYDECMGFEEVDTNFEFILNGVSNGFRIVDTDYSGSYLRSNYRSITKPGVKSQMDKLVRQELSDSKVHKVNCRPQCVHSLGAILKPDGNIRPITDCSRGDRSENDKSINDYMTTTCQDFHYTQVDDVTNVMKESSVFAVLDIQSAYRSVAVHPDDRTKQGFVWDLDGTQEYYEDGALSFGLRCAPFIFTQLTEFVIRCMKRRGIDNVFGYLDDFIIVADTVEECTRRQGILIGLLRRLGFRIAWKKLISPSTCVQYLGLIINSVKMEVSLPQNKLNKLVDLVDTFVGEVNC